MSINIEMICLIHFYNTSCGPRAFGRSWFRACSGGGAGVLCRRRRAAVVRPQLAVQASSGGGAGALRRLKRPLNSGGACGLGTAVAVDRRRRRW